MVTIHQNVDLLVIVILASEQINELTQELIKGAFYFTRIDSSGGLLEKSTVSLLIGISHQRLDSRFEMSATRVLNSFPPGWKRL
jgi:uncharacterized protein YaaQ